MEDRMHTTLRICLEPIDDAAMRTYCDKQQMTYSLFLRQALDHISKPGRKKATHELGDRRDVYGRLGKTSFSVRLNDKERESLVRFAKANNISERRNFSRIARYAIKTFLSSCADDPHQEQSPAPASADSPHP